MSAMRIAKQSSSGPVPGAVQVRPMKAADVTRVARLEVESFSTPWSAATFRTLLRRPGAELWVAELEPDGVIGYYVLWCIQDQGEVANIAVEERFRGRGIGAMLLDHSLEVAAISPELRVVVEVLARCALPRLEGVPVGRPRRDAPVGTDRVVRPRALHVGGSRVVRRVSVAEALGKDLVPDGVGGPPFP